MSADPGPIVNTYDVSHTVDPHGDWVRVRTIVDGGPDDGHVLRDELFPPALALDLADELIAAAMIVAGRDADG